MTYRALATRAVFALRSQINPALAKLTAVRRAAALCACILGLGYALGYTVGDLAATSEADARHAESLRRIIPVAEAALVALESEAEALADTIEALEGVEP